MIKKSYKNKDKYFELHFACCLHLKCVQPLSHLNPYICNLTCTSSFPTLNPSITDPLCFEGVMLTTTLWSICTSLLSSALLIKSSVFRSSTGLRVPFESCIKDPAVK